MNAGDRHARPEDLVLLEMGELSPEAEAELRRHLESCGICQAELSLAADFAHDAGEPAQDDRGERMRRRVGAAVADGRTLARPRRRSRILERTLMAAAVVFAAIGLYQFRPQSLPTGPGDTLRSSQEVLEIELDVIDTVDGWQLDWKPIPGAQDHQILVRSVRGETLLEGAIDGPGVVLSFDRPELRGVEGPLFVGVRCAVGDRAVRSNLLTLERP